MFLKIFALVTNYAIFIMGSWCYLVMVELERALVAASLNRIVIKLCSSKPWMKSWVYGMLVSLCGQYRSSDSFDRFYGSWMVCRILLMSISYKKYRRISYKGGSMNSSGLDRTGNLINDTNS